MGRVDLVLKAAARRLETARDLHLAEPVATRPLPAGGGMVISRNGFARLQRDGEILLGWSENGRSYGYGAMLIERLARGETVLCALPSGLQLEIAARGLWRDVKVLSLEPGTQVLRSGLSPKMAFARTASSSMARSRVDRILSDATNERIQDDGCVSTVVKALTDAIRTILPARGLSASLCDAASTLPAAPPHHSAQGLAKRKLRAGKASQQPPAKRADKPQIRATLTS